MSSGLVIVSNRLPVSVKRVDGKLEIHPSIGGLATGLASYAEDSHNKWIGWPGIATDDLSEDDQETITRELKKHNCYPVFLTQKQIDDYYNGYCNRLIWPTFHDIKVSKDARDSEGAYWRAYKDINELFAESVLALSSDGSTVWVHDYQLLLLPSLLRTARPDDRIGFFLHIPFPAAKNFKKLADGETLIAGMLGAGLVGFHTENYAQNFLQTTEHYGIGATLKHGVLLSNRTVRVLDFPMGIDYEKYAKARKSDQVEAEYEKLKKEYKGLRVILTVDRLDPSKGLVERAKAYQALLRENPSLHGKVTMIMIVVPSRTDIDEYKKLKDRLESVVAEITTTYATESWQPVVYRYESLPFHEVTALYRLADVAFIVPLRDGMNLVAKEYLASKPSREGVLVLSETAGAAQELKDAVQVNPKKQETVVRGLKQALSMPKKELKSRVRRMQHQLESATVYTWAGNFMSSLSQNLPHSTTRLATPSFTPTRQRNIVDDFHRAAKPLVFLDYDGTLVEFHRRPEDAIPTQRLKNLLKSLASHAHIVIVSGRKKDDLDAWFGAMNVSLMAEHGLSTKLRGNTSWHTTRSGATPGWQEVIRPVLEQYSQKAPGSFVEEKSASLVWHYRGAKPYHAQKNLVILKQALKPFVKMGGLDMNQGHKILEIRPNGITKGAAALDLVRQESPDFVLAIGDDYTDEDTFTSLGGVSTNIKVGPGRTAAQYRLKNVDAVLEFLTKLKTP